MYTKEIHQQFISLLKQYVDDPVGELINRTNFCRSTVNRFIQFKHIKPSTLDTFIALTIEIIEERKQKRSQMIEKGLHLNGISAISSNNELGINRD